MSATHIKFDGEIQPIHYVHPYFASFSPIIPRHFISTLTEKGAVVLDPFCGSGTTLIEAKLLGRNSVGIDVNPLACLITKVKTRVLSTAQRNICLSLSTDVKKQIDSVIGQSQLPTSKRTHASFDPEIPEFRNRDFWFQRHVLTELGIIRAHINACPDEACKDFLLVCLSAIIVRVSNQQHETRYRRISKNVPQGTAARLFVEKVSSAIQANSRYGRSATRSSCKVICSDLREHVPLEDDSVDLVVTSPPYLNAWDYHLYQKFRLFWLDLDYTDFRKREIGAHLRHSYMRNSLEVYMSDMKNCLVQISRVMRTDAYCCVVLGESYVRGKAIDVPVHLVTAARSIGLECVKTYDQPINGPHFSQPRSRSLKKERIILLHKL